MDSASPTTDIPQSGDAQPDEDFAAICADTTTGLRVDDTECDAAPDDYSGTDTDAPTYAAEILAAGATSAAMWYYLSTRNRVIAPAIGTRALNGTYTTPYYAIDGRLPHIARGTIDPRGGPLTRATIHRGGLGFRHHSGHS
jgi:hypothetical protein